MMGVCMSCTRGVSGWSGSAWGWSFSARGHDRTAFSGRTVVAQVQLVFPFSTAPFNAVVIVDMVFLLLSYYTPSRRLWNGKYGRTQLCLFSHDNVMLLEPGFRWENMNWLVFSSLSLRYPLSIVAFS